MIQRGGNILFGFGLGMIFANMVRYKLNKNLEKRVENNKSKINTNY